MYIRVRDCSKKPDEQDTIINTAKSASIGELRELIFEETGIEPKCQRLFFKGKLLIDEHTIMDYGLNLNDVIQLMVKPLIDDLPVLNNSGQNTESDPAVSNTVTQYTYVAKDSLYYQINDAIDFLSPAHGAWFEGKIVGIFQNIDPLVEFELENLEPDLIFRLQTDVDQAILELSFHEIRPRARTCYRPDERALNQLVMANYNLDHPESRGYWYDYIITRIRDQYCRGTILVGKDKEEFFDRTVTAIDELYIIERPTLLSERNNELAKDIKPRKTAYVCETCKDVLTKDCKACGCRVCRKKTNSENIILCDECDGGYHIGCLTPPLTVIPSDPEWYCPDCKVDASEIVQAGDRLKDSNKKKPNKRNKAKGKSKRNWGHGMATAGRTKECTIVPSDHFGPIPGVEIGSCWRYRLQVAEAGIHRPQVAGIAGRECDGAYSIVVSGGYEDDEDKGDEILYTGSGGRDLSGNKRVNEQTSDQVMDRVNKALAVSCNTPFNIEGGKAKDWRGGKPVRVVRSYYKKKRNVKPSKYAPKAGFRYDGIYKVVKYYTEVGKSGFKVCRYVLRRDDPLPAPWQKGGHDYDCVYPQGYAEAQAKKELQKAAKREARLANKAAKQAQQKRKPGTKKLVKKLTPTVVAKEEEVQTVVLEAPKKDAKEIRKKRVKVTDVVVKEATEEIAKKADEQKDKRTNNRTNRTIKKVVVKEATEEIDKEINKQKNKRASNKTSETAIAKEATEDIAKETSNKNKRVGVKGATVKITKEVGKQSKMQGKRNKRATNKTSNKLIKQTDKKAPKMRTLDHWLQRNNGKDKSEKNLQQKDMLKVENKSQQGIKRKHSPSNLFDGTSSTTSSSGNNTNSSTSKRSKLQPYRLTDEDAQLMENDCTNARLWAECRRYLKDGSAKFLGKVFEVFMCVCCQDLVHLPTILGCNHIICKQCLIKSFNSEIYCCPYCRFQLRAKFNIVVNEALQKILCSLFTGYNVNR